MKSLVIFDSNLGNTKIIAETIANVLETRAISVSDIKQQDLENLGLIVVGSPIIAWKPSEKMNKFLSGLNAEQLKNVLMATFDTRVKLFIHGDAMKKIADVLTGLGAKIIIESKAFYVKGSDGPLFDGEVIKAKNWATEIKQKLN